MAQEEPEDGEDATKMDTDGEGEEEENEGEDLTKEDMLGWYEPQEPTPAAAPDTRGDDEGAGAFPLYARSRQTRKAKAKTKKKTRV